MEDVKNNQVLCLNNEAFLEIKREKILSTLEENIDVFFFYDTETTGLNIYPKGETKRDRLLEVAFTAFTLDKKGNFNQLEVDGQPVTFHEYINPFNETKENRTKTQSAEQTNPEALKVHGITNNFLAGKEALNGIKLQKPAPTFAEVKPFMEHFLCLDKQGDFNANVHFVSHNGKSFDDKMLTEEMKYVDAFNPEVIYKRDFESLVSSSIDTKLLMQKLYTRSELESIGYIDTVKPAFSLDYLSKMLKVDLSARSEVHGGLLDSLILKDAFENLLKTDKYQSIHKKYEFNTTGEKEKEVPDFVINQISEPLTKGDFNTLNIIKTDASFHEGTGTVKEYVSRAKEAGLDNLVLADVVSLSRFIEFYETCKKENIKPIVGTTFRLESSFDIFNIFSQSKEQSKEARALVLEVVNKAIEQPEGSFKTFEELITESKVNNLEEWGKIITLIQKTQKALQAGNKAPNGMKTTLSRLLKNSNVKENKKVELSDLNEIIKKAPLISEFEGFDRVTGHSDLLLIAETDEGFENLKKLITIANKEGQRYELEKDRAKGEEPLITMDNLSQFNEGIMALIGGENDVLDRAIKSGYKKMPNGVINQLKSAIGEEKIAVQFSTNVEKENESQINIEQIKLNKLFDIATENNLMTLAAQSAKFAKKEDYQTHVNKYAVLLDKYLTDFSFSIPTTKEEYLKTKTQMENQFSKNPDFLVCANNVINRTSLNPVLHVPTLPDFKTEGGLSQAEELTKRAYDGLNDKVKAAYGKYTKDNSKQNKSYDEFYNDYKERLDYELGIIIDMDFPGYFLIKQQMIQFCKQEGIPVGAGRGSAAGSLVVYSLGITDVDPMEHGLIFERFLNPERKEMPDIDTDIDGEHREKVLNFLRKEYEDSGEGFEGAAYIMTKGTFSAKNTIRNLGKAKGLTGGWCDELAKLISKDPGVTLTSELENNEILRYRYDNEVKTKRLLNEAIELEKNGGRQASIGKHAGGIVVGNLISQAPITYINGIPVVQYDKNDIESAGAVKFDLLGLGTLAKLDLALKNIIEMKGVDELTSNNIKIEGKNFNFDNFNYDDNATYEMLREANSTNVFQIESNMFKGLLKLIKPENLDEITALVSLGRPGPLQTKMHEHFAESKFDSAKRHRYHPLIDELMDETHGSIIYQEQVMAIGQKMGGFTMGGADKLRKAMGKKKVEEMEKQKGLFIEGALKKNVSEEVATEIFETVETFAGYGFNKSHAMAYAFLTYKMAYLRKHYPTEFMAAVLTVDSNEGEYKKKIEKDVESMKEVGLSLFTPNINESEGRFKPGASTGILYGLDAITGLSVNDKSAIYKAREESKFESLEDFMKRAVFGKSVEKLIDSGAMDTLKLISKPNKEAIDYIKTLDKVEQKILKRRLVSGELFVLKKQISAKAKQKKYEMGSFDENELQSAYNMVINAYKANKTKMINEGLSREESVLSSYVTAHPLDIGGARNEIINASKNNHVRLSEIEELKDVNNKLNVAGLVKEVVSGRVGKSGSKYAFIEISDGTKTERMFMSNDGFNKVNSKIKEINGIGLKEGDVIGLDLSFYQKEDQDEPRTSIDKFVIPEYGISEDLGFKKKNQKRNRP